MTDMQEREAAALADFRDYIHANYGPGCVLSDPQWHAPKLFRAAVGSYLAAMPVPRTVSGDAIEDVVAMCPTCKGRGYRIIASNDPSLARGCATKVIP